MYIDIEFRDTPQGLMFDFNFSQVVVDINKLHTELFAKIKSLGSFRTYIVTIDGVKFLRVHTHFNFIEIKNTPNKSFWNDIYKMEKIINKHVIHVF